MKNLFTLFFLLISSAIFSQTPGWNWSRVAGGESYDLGSCIATDNSNNVITCGYFYGDTVFFGTHTLLNKGLNDFYIVKYDANGNVAWATSEGGAGDDYAIALAPDASGNIYVTGYFTGDSLIIGNDTLLNASAGYGDIFVAKYNSNGIPQWAKRFGAGDWDIAQAVAVEPSTGNFYVAGCYYNSTITIGTNTFTNNGLYDVLLIKFDPSGNVKWAKHSGGSLNDMGNAVATDNFGNIYISGGFASDSLTFGTTTLHNAGPGYPDIFVAKYDSAGNFRWTKRAGDSLNDHSVCVATDNSGNCFVGGHYHSASFQFASTTITNNGMGDVYLLKYDSAGNELWGRGQGGAMHDFGYAVAVDAVGNSYMSGMFNSSSMTIGTTTLTNSSMSSQDMFLYKYDPSGNPLWAISAGGMTDDEMNSIAIGSSGAIYATGDWRSPMINFGPDNYFNEDSTIGYADIFIGKLDVMTGMSTMSETKNIFLYPNPSNGIFTIRNNFSETFELQIFNSLGQEILRKENLNENNFEIDLGSEANGIYFMKVMSDENIYSEKIIIEK
ncbi:MAG: T9SS type A sorting domain-containing protein [Bacteroidetes bacterium]|nr:T9SS type A sorting domain-containing protein [Bacteroidota bacterium]